MGGLCIHGVQPDNKCRFLLHPLKGLWKLIEQQAIWQVCGRF